MYKKYFFISVSGFLVMPVFVHALVGHFADGIIKPGAVALLPASPLHAVIAAVMQWLLSIVGFIAIGAFVFAGILYMTSAGDDTQMEKAKKTAKYALVGIIVALGGMIVLQAVNVMLKGDSNF